MLDSHTICIAVPSLGDTTQTFVRAHISRLPYRIILLQGTPPIRSRAGKLVTGLPGALGLLLRTLAARLPSCLWIKRTAPGLAAYLRKSKVSVVLAQFGLAGIEMMGVCKVARIPLVVHFHGYDAYQRSVLRDHQEAYRTMFSTAFAVVAVSEHMCRQLVSLGAPSHKVKQITYGIDLEQFSESRPSENPPHFVAIGRFMEKKAPHLTILAFEQALAKVPDASLALYGEGPLLPYCKHLVRELGLGERITFWGPLDHADVPGVLRNGRAFLQHSITARNGDSKARRSPFSKHKLWEFRLFQHFTVVFRKQSSIPRPGSWSKSTIQPTWQSILSNWPPAPS